MSENMIVSGGEVFYKGEFLKKDIVIENGFIKEIVNPLAESGKASECLDASGLKVVPGFIDVHSHGGVNVDANDITIEKLMKLSLYKAKTGVCSYLLSIVADDKENTLSCIRTVKEYKTSGKAAGANLIGIHLEGPFLSKNYKGAIKDSYLIDADTDLIKEYQKEAGGLIKYITVAPELPGVAEAIPEFNRLGIRVAMGHSNATFKEAMAAIDAGAVACTHTFNAMRLFHQHEPAIFGAVLISENVFLEAILDGFHLTEDTVNFLFKLIDNRRIVGISDCIMAAGLSDGEYMLGKNKVYVNNHDAKLKDGTRAGSTLDLDRALRNLMKFSNRSLEEALPIFTQNPAKLLGISDSVGSIEEGRAADLVFLDSDNNVKMTLVDGVAAI